jgi:hypothetical protein
MSKGQDSKKTSKGTGETPKEKGRQKIKKDEKKK